MVKKPNFGKIAIVVFLTILIWVWADLAQDEPLPLRNFVTVSVAPSNQTLWVCFTDPAQVLRTSVTLENVDLRGPASRVADVERMKNKGTLEGDLFLVPEQEGLTEPGTRTFDVLNFLKQNDEIRQLGLTVESCEPRNLTVRVVQLDELIIPVECVDLNGNPIPGVTLDPARVKAHVPRDVTYTAKIELTDLDRIQARTTTIDRTPYVELAPGQRRPVATSVKVSLLRQEVPLAEYSFQGTLGFCFSPILQGQYRVEFDPDRSETALAAVSVKATQAALDAYRRQRFHILLYILDEDIQATSWIERPVRLDLPDEFVQKREIMEGEGQTTPARFRLVPVFVDTQESP
jgi:hypothetical protein